MANRSYTPNTVQLLLSWKFLPKVIKNDKILVRSLYRFVMERFQMYFRYTRGEIDFDPWKGSFSQLARFINISLRTRNNPDFVDFTFNWELKISSWTTERKAYQIRKYNMINNSIVNISTTIGQFIHTYIYTYFYYIQSYPVEYIYIVILLLLTYCLCHLFHRKERCWSPQIPQRLRLL